METQVVVKKPNATIKIIALFVHVLQALKVIHLCPVFEAFASTMKTAMIMKPAIDSIVYANLFVSRILVERMRSVPDVVINQFVNVYRD